jgi:methionyl-tRNA formyltransferase
VTPTGGASNLAPGEIAVGRSGVLVGTGTGAVALGEVRAAGKKPMPADAWARGVRPLPGEALT